MLCPLQAMDVLKLLASVHVGGCRAEIKASLCTFPYPAESRASSSFLAAAGSLLSLLTCVMPWSPHTEEGTCSLFPERCWSSSQRRQPRRAEDALCGTGHLPRDRWANTRAETVHGDGSTAESVTLLPLQEAKMNPFPGVPSSAGPLEPRAVQRGLSAHTGPRERPAVLPAALGSEPLSWTPPTLNTSFVNQRSTLHTMGTWRS